MNRTEFMMQLEKLLQDIPQEERIEALAYYNGYFEDAGEENEENIIMELESPEKVAKIIKADVSEEGNRNSMGSEDSSTKEYTEAGYQDQRFADPQEIKARGKDSGGSADNNASYQQEQNIDKQNRNLKILLLVIVGVITSPIWLGILGGACGIVIGIFGGVLGVLIALAAVVLALYVVGVALIGVGVSLLFVSEVAAGLGLTGSGLLVLALAVLGTIACMWIYGKFLPWFVKGMVAICSRPFRKGGRTI